jgi:hypothetical protein
MLDNILNRLWNNWMFRLSLSSNELFHSNFLQTVLSDPLPDMVDEHAGLTSWDRVQELGNWAGLDATWLAERRAAYEAHPVFVYREWKNLDLAIVVRAPLATGYHEVVIFAVELKIKSYPTLGQVERYLDVMANHNGQAPFVPRLVLLSLARPPALLADVGHLNIMHFGQLADGIAQLVPHQPNLQPAICEYAQLCALLYQLSTSWSATLAPQTPRHAVTGMKTVYRRLNPLWSKLCAAYLCERVREEMAGFTPGVGLALHTAAGFSNSTWSADFLWSDGQGDAGQGAVIAKVGVQVEGDTIRFMLNAQNVGNGQGNARAVVEQMLLAHANTSGLYKRLHQLYEITEATPADQVDEIKAFWQQVPGIRFHRNGLPALGQPAAAGFQLPGYNNGPGFGHADYRLKLTQDATLEQIGDLVCAALRGNYNAGGSGAFVDVLG